MISKGGENLWWKTMECMSKDKQEVVLFVHYTITRTFGVGALAAATGMNPSKLYGIDLYSSCKMFSRPCE